MSEAEIFSLTAADGAELKVRRWMPPVGQTPRAVVVYLHGIQSHGGWYAASASHLAEAGMAVYLPDRRGSGLNAADRGDCRHWEQLARDVTDLEARALADCRAPAGRRLPLGLLAVSWGGKLAAALAAMHHGRYAAVALLCPGICPQRDVPGHVKAKIARALVRKRPEQRFEIPLADPHLFTATPRWLEFLREDPLALRDATARFLSESRRLDQFIAWAAPWIHAPVFLALAGRDAIIDNARTQAYFARIGSRDKRVKVYEQAHHTLEFEADPTPVFVELADWFIERFGPGNSQGGNER